MSTETVQQNVVSKVGNPFLKKINVQEPLEIVALKGKRRICNAQDVFAVISGFDANEKHKALQTGPTHVEVHLVSVRKATFKEMFQEELRLPKETSFEEDQLIELASKYKHVLNQRGCIFALCHNGLGEYCIVSIGNTPKGLRIAKLPLDNTNIWDSHLYDYAVIKKML